LLIKEYFQEIADIINNHPAVQPASVEYDKRSAYIGFIRGSLWFPNNSVLHFREYADVQNDIVLYMYVYQYQNAEDIMIFRYDNTPHFPNLHTFPHHKHDGSESNVVSTVQPNLTSVLYEIQQILISE